MDEELKREFNALTLPYLAPLYRFALLISNENGDAEDLVHDTYLRAYRYYDRYEPGTNYKAWLFTMMRHIYINDCRKRAREVPLSDMFFEGDGGEYESPEGPSFIVHTLMGKGIFQADIQKAINTLPKTQRAVVILKDLEGFNYKEISQILDCPVGTVMSRLFRGRNFLKKFLVDYSKGRSTQKTWAKTLLAKIEPVRL